MNKKIFFIVIFFYWVNLFSQKQEDIYSCRDSVLLEKLENVYKEKLICKKTGLIRSERTVIIRDTNYIYDGHFMDYYLTGQIISEGVNQKGKPSRIKIYYHPNGKIHYINKMDSDTETCIMSFFSNGNISSNGCFLYEKEFGVWYYYYDNGKLESYGNYKLMKITDDNVLELALKYGVLSGHHVSYKDGEWFYYDLNGVLIKKEIYVKNELINIINY